MRIKAVWKWLNGIIPVLKKLFQKKRKIFGGDSKMAFTELVTKRSRSCKVFKNDVDPTKRRSVSVVGPIHYAGTVDGKVDTEVNFDVARINNAQLDGWLVSGGDFHYLLGIPQGKSGDGWIGFGGRQAQHWVMMKLRGIGYLHKPTRAWQGVGGNPTYNRANLSQVQKRVIIEGQEIVLATTATWTDIWATPGGGSVDLIIRADLTQLRVDVQLNQIAREWIQANAPPTTPIGQTWFGLAFELDYTNVPKLKQNGIEVSSNDDFTDDGDEIFSFETALDEVLGIMPTDIVSVPGTGADDQRETARLNKRFWKDTDNQFNGGNFLFTGAKVGILNGLRAGPLLFDPSITPVSPTSTDDDCDFAPAFAAFRINGYYGPNFDSMGKRGSILFQAGFRFDAVGLDNGVTVDQAIITFEQADWSGSPELLIYVEDTDDPGIWADSAGNRPDDTIANGTIAGIDWDPSDPGAGNTFDTVDIKTAIQPRVDDVDWDDTHSLRVAIDNDTVANNRAAVVYDWNHSTGAPAVLNIDFTVAGGGQTWPSRTKQMAHLLNR
jgi:hypothetical protein